MVDALSITIDAPFVEDKPYNGEKPAEVLIDGVLRCGGQMMIVAPPKSMKTQEALYIAYMLATGGTWRGHRCKKSRVLYVSTEMDQEEIDGRAGKIKLRFGLQNREIRNIKFVSLLGAVARDEHGEEVEISLQAIADMATHANPFGNDPVEVVVIDPISPALAGSNESDAGAMNKELSPIIGMRDANGRRISAILTHHTGKGGGDGKSVFDSARGSSVFAALVHTMVQIVQLRPRRGSDTWVEAERLGVDPLKSVFEMRFGRMRHFPDQKDLRVLSRFPILEEMHSSDQVSVADSREVAGGLANARRLESEREKKEKAVFNAMTRALRANEAATRANVFRYLGEECDKLGIKTPSEKTFRTWTSNKGQTNFRVNPETGLLYQVLQ